MLLETGLHFNENADMSQNDTDEDQHRGEPRAHRQALAGLFSHRKRRHSFRDHSLTIAVPHLGHSRSLHG
jgi:hypothetical protein